MKLPVLLAALALAAGFSEPVLAQETQTQLAPPRVNVLCVRVRDHEMLGGFAGKKGRSDPKLAREAGRYASLPNGGLDDPYLKPCPDTEGGTLVGTGDVIVAIDPAGYPALLSYQTQSGTRASLYLNGVFLGEDAEQTAVDILPHATFLTYTVRPGPLSRQLWASLYRSAPTASQHPMHAALGFASGPVSATITDLPARIAITDPMSFWVAIATIAGLVLFGLLLGYFTDIFRDARTPPAFGAAATLAARLGKDAASDARAMSGVLPDYDPARDDDYRELARQALKGDDTSTMDQPRLTVGLALSNKAWRDARASFSLGRVQLGMWFLFAVATGAFLFIVYGDLPAIDGSILALVGISLGVTGMSLAVDQDNPLVGYRRSRGLLRDLVTGWDDQHQVHRFQAVVVNILLLLVGVMHVLRHLEYPIFDATWLGFLAISGTALAAGKKLTEDKVEVPVPPIK